MPDSRNPEVSEEAAEAFCRAQYPNWDEWSEGQRQSSIAYYRRLLQAAAPILQREERERIREALLGKKAVTAVRLLYADKGINKPPGAVRADLEAALATLDSTASTHPDTTTRLSEGTGQ